MGYEHHSSSRRRHYSSSSDSDSGHKYSRRSRHDHEQTSNSEHSTSKRPLTRKKYLGDENEGDTAAKTKQTKDLRALIAKKRDLKSYYNPEEPTENSYRSDKLDIEIRIKNESRRDAHAHSSKSRSSYHDSKSHHHEHRRNSSEYHSKEHSYKAKHRRYSKEHSDYSEQPKQKLHHDAEPQSHHERKLGDFKKALEQKFDVSIDDIVKEILETKSSSQIKDMLNVDINKTPSLSKSKNVADENLKDGPYFEKCINCQHPFDLNTPPGICESCKKPRDIDSFNQWLNKGQNMSSQQGYPPHQNLTMPMTPTTAPLPCPPLLPLPTSYNYGVPCPAPPPVQPQYSAPQYSAPQYSAPQYSVPQYSAPQYSATQYSAPQFPPVTYNYGAPLTPIPPLPGMPGYNVRNPVPINNVIPNRPQKVQHNLPTYRPKLNLVQIKDSSNTIIKVLEQDEAPDVNIQSVTVKLDKAPSQQKVSQGKTLESDKSQISRIPVRQRLGVPNTLPQQLNPASTSSSSTPASSASKRTPAIPVENFRPGLYDTQSFDYSGAPIICKTPQQLIKTLNNPSNKQSSVMPVPKNINLEQTVDTTKRTPADLLKTLVMVKR